MIGPILYWRAKRNPATPFDRYLVEARDRFAWRARVAGGVDLPGWLRPAGEPLHEANVRILAGRPARTLVLIDEVEEAAGVPIRNAWPALRGFIHEGEPFAPYEETYRRRLGTGIAFVAGKPDGAFFSNAFGERLDEATIDAAIARTGCAVAGFAIEPEYPTVRESRGRHVWRVAFERLPDDLSAFGRALDDALKDHGPYAEARAWMRAPMVRLAT